MSKHANTLGVVLAAGDATRMPNKTLLPLMPNGIVVESALSFLRAVGVKSIVVVVREPGGILPTVLQLRGWTGLGWIYQPEPRGPLDAMVGCLKQATGLDRMLVAFGDNVYGRAHVEAAKSVERLKVPAASTVLSSSTSLDFHCDGAWFNRQESLKPEHRFAGWLYTYTSYLYGPNLAYAKGSLLAYMNVTHTRACDCGDEVQSRWYDVGTPDSYLRYLNEARTRPV